MVGFVFLLESRCFFPSQLIIQVKKNPEHARLRRTTEEKKTVSSKRGWGKAVAGQSGPAGGGMLQLLDDSAAPPYHPIAFLCKGTHSVIESFGICSWETVRLQETEMCLTVILNSEQPICHSQKKPSGLSKNRRLQVG